MRSERREVNGPAGGFSVPSAILALAVVVLLVALALPVLQRSAQVRHIQEADSLVRTVRDAMERHRDERGRWPVGAPPGRIPEGLARYLPAGTDFQHPGLLLQTRLWRTVEAPELPPEPPESLEESPADTIPVPPPSVEALAGLSVHADDPALLAALLSSHGTADSFVRDTVWTLVLRQRARPR